MKRGKKKVSSHKKTFIWILVAILFIEILFVVDYSFTGNIISKTLDKTLSVDEVEERIDY